MLSPNDRFQMPAMLIPNFRSSLAIQKGCERNLLFRTWGGIGDQICAEPTLRYALKSFKDCKITLASEMPELFNHLEFHEVYNLKRVRPVYENYLCFETITPPDDSNLTWQFFSHMLTHCVDFPSLCALRSQLPVADREVVLKPKVESEGAMERLINSTNRIFVHPGKHWPSKTFPKLWWDLVLKRLIAKGIKPVLIGANTDDNRGTVDVDSTGCFDLRNMLSISESIWLLQRAQVLLTNDSSPLHMAASGKAWIGFIATCKHPDLITHWRKNQWGWRMENLGLGGMWDDIDHCPNKGETVTVDQLDPEKLAKWLPNPNSFADWAISKAVG